MNKIKEKALSTDTLYSSEERHNQMDNICSILNCNTCWEKKWGSKMDAKAGAWPKFEEQVVPRAPTLRAVRAAGVMRVVGPVTQSGGSLKARWLLL